MAKDNFHPVPAIRRLRNNSPLESTGEKTNLTSEHGPVTRTEVEKQPDGTHHLIAHHAKNGHVEVHPHATSQEAHEHGAQLMSGGDGQPSGDTGDGTETECPQCGAQMQDGKCPQCGYEEPLGADTSPIGKNAGAGEPDQDDKGY